MNYRHLKYFMNRRKFLMKAGTIGVMSPFALSTLAQTYGNLASPQRITKIETVRFKPSLEVAGRGIQWMWVRLHTNEGIIGTGETYPFNEASQGAVQDLQRHSWMGKLIGTNPLEIEQTWDRIYKQSAYHVSGGAEMRALSAINLAQWDILGQTAGLPIYELLGGTASSIPVYNTYTNARNIEGWTLEKDMEKIAQFLVDQKIPGIKYCPFDVIGNRNKGQHISLTEIEKCLEWVKRVRDTVGDQLEIGIEFHSIWNLPSAVRIATALEPYNIWFLEDMMLQGNMQSYVTLSKYTSVPIVISERLASRFDFREYFESKVGGIAMYDLTWCGGISEGKKISDMANTYYMPTMMHTAGGPILWYASTHLATAVTNLFHMESVYPNWKYRYPYFFDNAPQVVDGKVSPPTLPGLGLSFKEGLFDSEDLIVETVAEA